MVALEDNVFSCASFCVRVDPFSNSKGLVDPPVGFCIVEDVSVASLEIGGLEADSESMP